MFRKLFHGMNGIAEVKEFTKRGKSEGPLKRDPKSYDRVDLSVSDKMPGWLIILSSLISLGILIWIGNLIN